MASILDKHGIKEVADITFYELDNNGKPAYPVLYIDTAKTSTIEQTADEVVAKGGKGNPTLIAWDCNKDITVTLEDALFSAKSLAIMFGNGKVDTFTGNIMKTEVFMATATTTGLTPATAGWIDKYEGPNGKWYAKLNAKFFDENGIGVEKFVEGNKYFCSFDLAAAGSKISIGANTFPGTYYVTGDTWARAQSNGDDDFFQFIIPKAKVKSENTITLEADGDPSVFKMDLHVLRPDSGEMMKLVQYTLTNDTTAPAGDGIPFYHNHELNLPNSNAEGTPATKDEIDTSDNAREAALDATGEVIENILVGNED